MLLDYVKEYADVALSGTSMSYLDLLVFSELVNFDYPSTCFGKPLPEALACATMPEVEFEKAAKTAIVIHNDEDVDLAAEVKAAKRYSAVRLITFDSAFKEGEGQFGAMLLQLEDLSIVAFRGTDETYTGWRESIALSKTMPVYAQVEAMRFLETAARKTSGPLVVCGHSKGGNLAVFSAANLAEEDAGFAQRIAYIASFDGPGVSKALQGTDGYARIADRIQTFIPQGSIIGPLFSHAPGRVEYIKSTVHGPSQHYPYFWKTEGEGFIPAKQDIGGRMGSAGLQLISRVLDDPQKDTVINLMFKPFEATRTHTFHELIQLMLSPVRKIAAFMEGAFTK